MKGRGLPVRQLRRPHARRRWSAASRRAPWASAGRHHAHAGPAARRQAHARRSARSIPRYLPVRGDGGLRDRHVRVRQLATSTCRLPVAQDFAGLGSAVTGHRGADHESVEGERCRAALETALGFPYRAEAWQEQNSSLFRALKLEKFAMGFIVLPHRPRRGVQHREHAHHGRHATRRARSASSRRWGCRARRSAGSSCAGLGDRRRRDRHRSHHRPRGWRGRCSSTTS